MKKGVDDEQRVGYSARKLHWTLGNLGKKVRRVRGEEGGVGGKAFRRGNS
jgi:hypothetical protein